MLLRRNMLVDFQKMLNVKYIDSKDKLMASYKREKWSYIRKMKESKWLLRKKTCCYGVTKEIDAVN